ncbi:MAG: hypothetical protein AAGF87_12890, partial [Bacteroidota bacterium]
YTPLGDELPFLAVSSIVVDADSPSTIYIALSDHVWYGPPSIGVYKSNNGGTSWQPTALSLSFTSNTRIYWMEADPNDPQTILVATQDGLYRTTNGFQTVSQINTMNCFHVRFHPANSNVVYLSDASGRVFRSTNNGQSFSLSSDLGNGRVYLEVGSQDMDVLYARASNSLFRSANQGQTFTQVGTTQESNEAFRLALNNNDIILSGNFEISRSTNGGASFNTITNWLGNNNLPLIHVDQRNVFTNPLQPDFIYFCNDGGVFRYQVSTENFEDLSDGLLITQFYDIAVSQSDAEIVGGGSQDNGNVYRNANGLWQQYASTGDGMNQDIDPTDANIRFWSYQLGGLRRWQNGSNIFIEPPGSNGGAWETPFKLDPSNPNRLIVGYSSVYESLNQGNTWAVIGSELAGGADMTELAIAPSNGNRIYAVQGANLYVKSVDSNSWTTKSLPSGNISDLEVDFVDVDLIYISAAGYADGQKVWRSSDAGDTWTNISGDLPNVSTGAIELVDGTDGGIFVGNDNGVYYRDNQSNQWDIFGDLPNTRVEDIEIQYSAEIIRVGTHGRGVLEAPLTVLQALPVEWSRFTAEARPNRRAELVWEIASADNFSHFVVERSFDGRHFEEIGEVFQTSAGRSVYTYTDVVLDHLSAYYRIRALDLDGSYSHSVMQRVSWDEDDLSDLVVYPNPTDGLLFLEVAAGKARIVNWAVVDLRGALARRGVCSVEADAGRCRIAVQDLPEGSYWLQCQDGDQLDVARFVKR